MKSFSDLYAAIKKRHDDAEQMEIAERRERRRVIQSNRVVGGVYRPLPIDKAAAMLVSKSPWFFHPPQSESAPTPIKESAKMPEKQPEGYTEVCMQIGRQTIFPTMHNGELMYSVDDMAKALIAHAKTVNPELEKLSMSAADCRSLIDESVLNVGRAIEDFDRATKDAYGRVRMQRQAIVTDCAQMTTALRDVRQFFLGPDFDREQKRLAEFVELCERLKSLKDSGFLDTVADTMIRLSSSEPAS